MKTRKFSIRLKITLLISLVSIVGFCSMGFIIYNRVGRMFISQMKTQAMSVAQIAADEIEGAQFAAISSSEDEGYKQVYKILSKYQESDDIQYVYSMKQTGDNQVVFVVDTDPEDPAEFEEEYEWLEDFEEAFAGEVCADKSITKDEWGEYFSAYAPIFDGDKVVGIVGMDIPINVVNRNLALLRAIILLLVVIFVALCIVAAIIIGTILGNNLNKMTRKVKELNSGDGDLTQKLDIQTGDELENIANEFNTFINSIRVLVEGVADNSNVVSKNSDGMDKAVIECHSNLTSISENLQDLSANMEETAAKTNLIVDNIENSNSIVQEVFKNANENAKEALEVSHEASRKQREISAKAANAEKVVAKLKKDLEEASVKCQAVQEIRELADEILDVADTTRILSLNANIEAARAGAAGKGFSVIADDVQKLSDQITVLVEDIQKANEGVIAAVENLTDNVSKTTDFLNETVLADYQNFEKIGNDYSDRMNDMSQVLSEIDEELLRVSELFGDMRNDAKEIDFAVEISTEKITNVASNSVVLEDSMSDLSTTADNNNNVADSLMATVQKFKY